MSQLSESELLDVMNGCLNKLQFSTPQYVMGSNPYVTAKDKDAVKAVAAAGKEDEKLYGDLMRMIEAKEGVPQGGLPDPLLADLNYLSYPRLLDILIRDKESELAKCRRRADAAEGSGEVHALLTSIADAHEAHATKFKEVRARRYKSEEPAAESA